MSTSLPAADPGQHQFKDQEHVEWLAPVSCLCHSFQHSVCFQGRESQDGVHATSTPPCQGARNMVNGWRLFLGYAAVLGSLFAFRMWKQRLRFGHQQTHCTLCSATGVLNLSPFP